MTESSREAGPSTDPPAASGEPLPARPLVLHVRSISGFGGGPEKTILNSPRFLEPLGYDSICAYMHPVADPGLDRLRELAAEAKASLVTVPERGPLDWRVAKQLIRICVKHQPAIWHGHDYKSNFLGLVARRFWPMKLVTTVHGWVQRTRRTPFYYALDKLCIRCYDGVICVSDDVYQECKRAVRKRRCHLIANAIDADAFRRGSPIGGSNHGHGTRPDEVLLGAMGRLEGEKGFDLLIRAVRLLIQRGHKVSLWIAGEGDARPELESLLHKLGANRHIRLLGHVRNVKEFFEALDVFVLSSRREGLPNVLLEAMSMEVPVIATRVAGIPSLIRDGENGLLVNTGSAEALAARIEHLVDNKTLWRRLSEAGRRTIVQSYSFESRMRRIADIYDEVLSDSGPSNHARRSRPGRT